MKTLATAAAALSLLLAPLAEASPKNGRGNGNGNGNGNGAWSNGVHCPPGLARRDRGCVPPGQARRGDEERRADRDAREEARRADRDAREDAEDRVEDAIDAADDDDDRDRREALAIVGTLAALALIERARRDSEPDAAAAPDPVIPPPVAPAPSIFSFSEVPSRPSSVETLATAPYIGDATDPGLVTEMTEPETFAGSTGPDTVLGTAEPVASAASEPTAPTADRLVALRPLPAPVPTPEEEEGLLSDVFQRAADEGDTGF